MQNRTTDTPPEQGEKKSGSGRNAERAHKYASKTANTTENQKSGDRAKSGDKSTQETQRRH